MLLVLIGRLVLLAFWQKAKHSSHSTKLKEFGKKVKVILGEFDLYPL